LKWISLKGFGAIKGFWKTGGVGMASGTTPDLVPATHTTGIMRRLRIKATTLLISAPFLKFFGTFLLDCKLLQHQSNCREAEECHASIICDDPS
jgi:hypothetical protein